MIVSHKHRFLIATPTKCGTDSLVRLFVNHMGVAEFVLPKHRMDVPEGCQSYRRYFITRNPYSRLVSMYDYLMRRGGQWGSGHFTTFSQFLRYHQKRCREDPSLDWTNTNWQNHNLILPHHWGRLEQFEMFVRTICEKHKLKFQEIPHANKAKKRRRPPIDHFNRKQLELVRDWCRKDCLEFGYKLY